MLVKTKVMNYDVFMKLHRLMGYNFQIEKCKFLEDFYVMN